MRVYDINNKPLSENIVSCSSLNDVIYEPCLKSVVELRPPNINGSATIVIRIDTIDKNTKKSKIIGFSVFPVFHTLNTDFQPLEYEKPFALNIGYYQLPLYQTSPSETLRGDCLDKANKVPCSTVLIRILKAIKKDDKFINYNEREKETGDGYIYPESYSTGCYNSIRCKPTECEKKLYEIREKRLPVLEKNIINHVLKDGFIDEESATLAILNSFSEKPEGYLTYNECANYSPKIGFRVLIDSIHTPKKSLFKVLYTLYPPAQYYINKDTTNCDFTIHLKWESELKHVYFEEEYKIYDNIPYDESTLLIMQVYKIKPNGKNSEYGWSVFPVFVTEKEYVKFGYYGIQLYQGKFQSVYYKYI